MIYRVLPLRCGITLDANLSIEPKELEPQNRMTKWFTPAFTNLSKTGMTSSGVPTATDDLAIGSGMVVAPSLIFTIQSWFDMEYSVKYFLKSNPSMDFRL